MKLIKKKNAEIKTFLQSNKYKLSLYENNLKLLDPKDILRRGFSITYHNGKTVKDSSLLNKGDEIMTMFYKGNIKSKID